MRLLSTQEPYKLQLFEGDAIPAYAILSHRWGSPNDEVSFIEIGTPAQKSKPGYAKIKFCCDQASKDNLKYCWIDTCCIDKSSSAELSEAINSMYEWYRKSKICYAYLEDVDDGPVVDSCWFTRGWTLQELIAPAEVQFFNKAWAYCGSKSVLANDISVQTRIPWAVLQSNGLLGEYSVADKFTWASTRKTTRKEDEAYCLLGLFGVNMSLIYGEGEKAFSRLQKKVLKHSTDLSILAFQGVQKVSSTPVAMSPAAFALTGKRRSATRDILTLASIQPDMTCAEKPILTESSLAITLWLMPYRFGVYLAPVCIIRRPEEAQGPSHSREEHLLCIILQRDDDDGRFRRIYVTGDDFAEIKSPVNLTLGRSQRVNIAPPTSKTYSGEIRTLRPDLPTVYGFYLDDIDPYAVKSLLPKHETSKKSSQIGLEFCRALGKCKALELCSGQFGIAGGLSLSKQGPVLVFSLDVDFNPSCLLLYPTRKDNTKGPFHWVIDIPETAQESFCFGNNKHMSSLAAWLRGNDAAHQGEKIQANRASLFWSTSHIQKAEFTVCRGVSLSFLRTFTGYEVSLRCSNRGDPKSPGSVPSSKSSWHTRTHHYEYRRRNQTSIHSFRRPTNLISKQTQSVAGRTELGGRGMMMKW